MSSQAQIDANRLNAQKSSGPATEDGKAKSRFNAVKHRAYAVEAELTGEDPAKFVQRESAYFQHFKPEGPEETFLVKAMIAAENDHDRCCLLESFTLASMIEQQPAEIPNPLGDAVAQDSATANALEKLAKRKSAAYARWVRSNKLIKQSHTERAQVEVFMTQAAVSATAAAMPPRAAAPAREPSPNPQPAPQPQPQNTTRPATQPASPLQEPR